MVHLLIHQSQTLNLCSSIYSSNDGDSQKKKRCKYCRKAGHTIDECRKLAKRNEKKKESGMTIAENSSSAKSDEANMAQDCWACVDIYYYNASLTSNSLIRDKYLLLVANGDR